MGLEKDLIGNLKRNHNLVLVYEPEGYSLVVQRMHKTLSKAYGKICVVSSGRPLPETIGTLDGQGIDHSGYFFIDCASGGHAAEEGERRVRVRPGALDELAGAVERFSRKGAELVVVDDVSALLRQSGDISILKFLHALMMSLRKTDTKSVYLIKSDAKEYILADLELFSDSVVRAAAGRSMD